ncbi:alanine--tRNA ligase-related protein [Limnoraphis robusta]|uniref:Alanine--tRNA ligase-related protein n=1 Tax=Limnoraphis robusta CCNP1315 TaxID=3110306 RepID=A0ABU5U207_9CYAN|nr:alanine--tRNA ligase-related protein [Limnoraphis robusta]MEA5521231.1 alanine--tRNA ligase-related protein [Limnoraphis robusta CCNP1315]MEA5548969.1 alanine--tRNA ligase-related protein [Limnoraphis robusta CCNP1324]
MTTQKLYLSSFSQTQGQAKITHIEDGEKPFIRLDQTWFHAQGGGQKADKGTINGISVVHVAHNNSEVDHYVESIESFIVGQEVDLIVDEDWRLINGKYHLAGHLIAALIENMFPDIRAIGGHHWPGEARIELRGNLPENKQLEELLSNALKTAIEADLPVYICGDPFSNRSIGIGEFTPVPCGGTHPERLGILETVKITKVKTQKDKLKVSYRV